jgi:hypothetical protein
MKNFGFTAENVTAAALRLMGRADTDFAPTAPAGGHS